MTFGQRLRQSRKVKKMTQKQLATAIGAKHNSVSDWENDKNKPDPDTIELLCGVLEITPNYLLNSSDDDISPFEKEMIKKYRVLDEHGKEMVDFTLQKEWERSTLYEINRSNNYMKVAESMTLYDANAAHGISGASSEDQKHDDDIMNSDKF